MSDLERGSVDETARLNGEPVLPGGRRKSSSSSGPSQISFRVMAAFAVFALLGTLGSFVTSWGGDIAQVLQLASHKSTPVSFIHVPRTAGTTLGFTVQALGVPITGEDRCYKYSHRENAINAVVFRDPTEHVLSLFGQCFANPHGAQSMSPLWGFPRGKKGDTPEAGWRNGLTKWLAHFGENWERERGYFNCFNPINMQARYLTCGGKDEIHDKEVHLGAERWGTPQKPGRAVWFQSAHYLGVNDAVEPDLDKVIRRLDSMQVVGVTEALKATTCLTEYYSRGTIHPSCECGSDERKFPWRQTRNANYAPFHFSALSEKARGNLMNVTRVDRVLHRYAVKRFIRDSLRAEEKMGKQFLCASVRRELDQVLDQHEDGELEAALDVPWGKYKPSAKSVGATKEAAMGSLPFEKVDLKHVPKTYTPDEQNTLMRKMTSAKAKEVLPAAALVEVPMTHFEYAR